MYTLLKTSTIEEIGPCTIKSNRYRIPCEECGDPCDTGALRKVIKKLPTGQEKEMNMCIDCLDTYDPDSRVD